MAKRHPSVSLTSFPHASPWCVSTAHGLPWQRRTSCDSGRHALSCAPAGSEQLELEGELGPGDEACLAAGSLGGEGLALRLVGERGDPARSPGHPPAEPAPLTGAARASRAPNDAPADPAARPRCDSLARPAGARDDPPRAAMNPSPEGWSPPLAWAGLGGQGADGAAPAGGAWWGAASGGGRARLLPAAGEARALELAGAGGAALRCVLAAEPAAPARHRARPPPALHPHQCNGLLDSEAHVCQCRRSVR